MKPPKVLLRFLKYPPRLFYSIGFARFLGHRILLLTSIGRKSGLPRVTPLQYETIDGCYYLGSAFGTQADWYRNILVDNHVKIRVQNHHFDGIAEATSDIDRITNYLEFRLKHYPRMIKGIMRADGITDFSHEGLKTYAKKLALVIIKPT